jgi:hypothetical protein
MGSQQLLLIIVGVIILAVAFAVGITMFKDQAAASNRDSLSNDLAYLSSKAQEFYRKPLALGGGQKSFDGITLLRLTTKPVNANGSFDVESAPITGNPASIVIVATGVETGNDGTNKVFMAVRVWPDSTAIEQARTN